MRKTLLLSLAFWGVAITVLSFAVVIHGDCLGEAAVRAACVRQKEQLVSGGFGFIAALNLLLVGILRRRKP